MTEYQAITIADTFIQQQLGPDPRIHGDRYGYSLLRSRVAENNEWRIVYRLVFPDYPDRMWDGPTVVIVDPITQKASFFNSP